MRIDTLLRLYPRAWRDRYQDEFVAMLGARPLSAQQIIDVVSGAIDAWLSADVRHASQAMAASQGEPRMTLRAMLVCDQSKVRMTNRDGLIGGAVMIGGSVAGVLLATAAKRAGWTVTAEILLNISFFVSLTLSMPFWLMKGQSWKAQTVVVASTLVLLVASTLVAMML